MKANELMIGDLVNLSPGKANIPTYVMIHAIKYDNHVSKDYVFDIVFLSTGLVQYNYSIRSLKPIPLTPEILEKNGFLYNDAPFVQGWEQFGLTLYRGGNGYRINCGFEALVIDSVHELQHALRLCGIEKEITM